MSHETNGKMSSEEGQVGTIFPGVDSPERIVEMLLAMEDRRPGLAYDVGRLLLEKGVSKEFPGPDPWDENPKSLDHGAVYAVAYDPARREDAITGYRLLRSNPIPTYDENDPKWLKATKAERRAAKRAVEDWTKYPNRDRAPVFIEILNRAMMDTEVQHRVAVHDYMDAPKSRAEAEALQAKWAEYGVVTVIEGYEEPDKSHRRTLALGVAARG